jgi:hypothetical protein
MADRETTRVQLELPSGSMNRLRVLRDKTEASSYAEVLKNALRLYEALIKETQEGNSLVIMQKNGEQKEYKLLF